MARRTRYRCIYIYSVLSFSLVARNDLAAESIQRVSLRFNETWNISSGLVIVTYFYEIEFSFLFLSPQLNIDNIDGVKKTRKAHVFGYLVPIHSLQLRYSFFHSCDEGGGVSFVTMEINCLLIFINYLKGLKIW